MSNPTADNPGPRDEPTGDVRHDAMPSVAEMAAAGFTPLPPIDAVIPGYARINICGMKLVHKTGTAIFVRRLHRLSKPKWMPMSAVRVSVGREARRAELLNFDDVFDVNLPVSLYRKIFRSL